MSTITLSENAVENVKHIIYGNQKQANVQNESVVKLIARGVVAKHGDSALATEDSAIKAITDLLQAAIDTNDYDETLIMLIGGEVSLANLKADGPKVVVTNQPNPESPKMTFRIAKFGDTADTDMSAEVKPDPAKTLPSDVITGPDIQPPKAFRDIVHETEKLKDAIIKVAPASVLEQFGPGNEYAAALYMYPSFAKVNDL